MTRLESQLVYMGHPVSGDVDGNVKRALRWLAWLRRMNCQDVIIAPWIAALLAGEDDNDPAQRARGLADCEVAAARCDGIVLVGGEGARRSSGMRLEVAAVLGAHGWVSDLTRLGAEPPASWDFDHDPLEVGLDAFDIRRWRTPS